MPQPEPAVLDNDFLTGLFAQYVQFDGEQIRAVKTWPGSLGAVVETDGRLLSIRVEPSFLLIGRAPWVDALVVVERADILGRARPETDVIAVVAGRGLHLNDPATVAELGRRLRTDLAPAAYVEILVAYHPFTAARQDVVSDADDLRRLGIEDGPPVGRLVSTDIAGLLVLEFFATTVYAPVPGAARCCDVYRWRVELPPGGPAAWHRELIAQRLRVTR
jgi:hypothetical protein